MMTTAAVILNYNSEDVTLKLLRSIEQNGLFQHVIVPDNASPLSVDALKAYCRAHGVDFLPLTENKGYAAGNAAGVRYALEKYQPDVVFISNPDVICPRESVDAILAAMADDPRVGIATGLVHTFDKEGKPQIFSSFAYRVPEAKDMYLHCLLFLTRLRRKLHGSMYLDGKEVQAKGKLEAGCVSGCFFAIRADAYRAIGGFDEDTFLYWEEPILGCQLRQAGYRAVVVSAPVYHDEDPGKRKTLKKQWRTYRIKLKSAQVYLRKYLKVKGFGCAVYRILSFIGFWENVLILKIKK